MIGASIAYAIGYWGRDELVERHGNKLHISPARLELAHSWFERYGAPVILVSRLLPFVRAAFPYAAGVAEMPYWRFLSFATIGSIIWIGGLGVLGKAVGSNWQSWRHNLEYVDYAVVASGRGRDRLPDRAARSAAGSPRLLRSGVPPRAAERWCLRPAIAGGACRSGRRSRSARCTGRPSCCRSPPRATSRSSHGCSAGTTTSSTTSCASRSRSRSTPARRRRC